MGVTTGCCGGRTATGGVSRSVDPGNGTTTYEVRADDVPLAQFRSAIAAATYARGMVGATVHRVKPDPT